MRLRKLLIYGILAVSILILQFGPYNNFWLTQELAKLRSESRYVQALRDEFWVLSTMNGKTSPYYIKNSALTEAVSDYLQAEEQESL